MHFIDAKSILSAGNVMNIYRGCTHGCIYCDSRSKCYGFTHQFEDIEVKRNAPELLELKLCSKRKKCMIMTGAMCDPYMHCEEKLGLTRKCLEIINKYEYGVDIQTKSDRILRDMDLLASINEKSKCVVQITLTTFDDALCSTIEPNVCVTSRRFQVLERMRDAGIPAVVWMTPILPFINDTRENIIGILDYCIQAKVQGIINVGMGVTLREGDREYFYASLDKHFPGLKEKYHSKYGYSYEVLSERNEELMSLFTDICKAHGIMYNSAEIFEYMRKYPEDKEYTQMSFL